MKHKHLNDAAFMPTKVILAYVAYVNGCNCAECPDCKTLRNLNVSTEYEQSGDAMKFKQRGECPVCAHKFHRRWTVQKRVLINQYSGQVRF